MKRYFLPVLLAFLFVSEGTAVSVLPTSIWGVDVILVPYFLFISLLFLGTYYDPMQAFYYGCGFGFLFDLVHTEILGVYVFVFPLCVYLFVKIMKMWQLNIVMASLLLILTIGIVEYCLYGFTVLIGRANMSLEYFSLYRVLPTLGLNAVFTILFSFSLQKYFLEIKKEKESL